MKAFLKNYRQQPRKTRLIADLVRGKDVKKALTILKFTEKRAAGPFSKVLKSAVANAKAQGKKEESLYIKNATVDKGSTFKRYLPRARGSASLIRKRSSHILIELGERK